MSCAEQPICHYEERSDVIILNRRVLSQMRSRCFASPLRVRLRPPCHYERNEVESKRFSAAEGVISGRPALRMTRSKFLRKDCRGIKDASRVTPSHPLRESSPNGRALTPTPHKRAAQTGGSSFYFFIKTSSNSLSFAFADKLNPTKSIK